MNYFDVLFAKKQSGGGTPTLITKTITENGTYNASEDNADGYSQVTVAVEGFKKKSIANTPTNIASFDDGTANPMPSLEISIEPVQSGSGDPSPSNVRPISGWSGANVTRCGVNLFDGNFSDWKIIDSYSVLVDKLPSNTLMNMSLTDNDTSVDISDIYLGFINNYTGGAPATYKWIINNGTVGTNKTNNVNNILCNQLFMYPKTEGSLNLVKQRFNVQVELGSTATTYTPYQGSTLSIPFHNSSDNPITVYGGTLNVTSGELTVTMASIDLGTRSYTQSMYGSNTVFYCYIGNCANIPSSQVADALCSCYAITSNDMIYSGIDKRIAITKSSSDPYAIVRIANSDYTDVTAFTQSLSNQKLVYELATPQTYQLTPAQVATLLGQNNIFADCGQILEGEYFVTL